MSLPERERKRNGMPFLLRVAMALGALFGIFGTSVGLWGLLRVVVGDGPFRIDEAVVSRAEFVAVAGPFLVLYILACLTAGAAGWAIWRRRARSRALLVALLTEFVLGDVAMLVLAQRMFDVGAPELVLSVSLFIVLVALGLWYLFHKASVAEYYDSLRKVA